MLFMQLFIDTCVPYGERIACVAVFCLFVVFVIVAVCFVCFYYPVRVFNFLPQLLEGGCYYAKSPQKIVPT